MLERVLAIAREAAGDQADVQGFLGTASVAEMLVNGVLVANPAAGYNQGYGQGLTGPVSGLGAPTPGSPTGKG